jgi:hypothetical protein
VLGQWRSLYSGSGLGARQISATLSYNMAKLTDEQRRALQLLAREHAGCAEVVLLAEGFSVGQLAEMPAGGDLGAILEAARKRSPLTLGDLTPEEYEAVLEARAKAGPEAQPLLAQPTDLSAKPMVSDRRFRRT